MKTVTEFSGFVLAEALKKVAEMTPKPVKVKPRDKKADRPAGKPPEAAPKIDLPAVIGETFKLEGDKLAMFMNAIDAAKRRPQHIKRVVVLALNEGEKAPEGAFEKDGKVYLLEHFFVPQPRRDDRREGKRFGKGGKGRGGRDRDRGRGGPGGGREGGGGGGGRPGGGRPGRGPRKEGERPAVQAGGKPAISVKPNVKPNVSPTVKPNVTPASTQVAAPKTEEAQKS